MKLTSRSEYALLALVFLARQPADSVTPAEQIATAQKIPHKFLEQIMLLLKRGGFVRSVKGMRGGYLLARRASEITLAEVIRLIDGALAPTDSVSKHYYESTPIEQEEELVEVFREIRDFISKKLERTTVADVA